MEGIIKMAYLIIMILLTALLSISVALIIIGLDEQKKKKYSPKSIGLNGEKDIYRILNELEINKRILHNVIIPKDNRTSTQIDLILITAVGIYAIESKNYSGSVYGTDIHQKWQHFVNNRKYVFDNPIYQNLYHIECLKNLLNLGTRFFKSYIIFGKNTKVKVKRTLSDYDIVTVTTQNSLIDNIYDDFKNNDIIFTQDQIDQIYLKLKVYEQNKIRNN